MTVTWTHEVVVLVDILFRQGGKVSEMTRQTNNILNLCWLELYSGEEWKHKALRLSEPPLYTAWAVFSLVTHFYVWHHE